MFAFTPYWSFARLLLAEAIRRITQRRERRHMGVARRDVA
jgi:hypothetical protein